MTEQKKTSYFFDIYPTGSKEGVNKSLKTVKHIPETLQKTGLGFFMHQRYTPPPIGQKSRPQSCEGGKEC